MTTSENCILVAHEGVQITLGGRTFVLPPMTLAMRKKEMATRRTLGENYDDLAEQELLLEVMVETLKRNYPALTKEELEPVVDFPELIEAYARLKEQEARLMADLGKRVAAAALAAAAPSPSTTSSQV